MKKIDYRWYGLAALVIHALGGLMSLWRLSFTNLHAYGVFLLVSFVVSAVLAEVWAVLYWKTARTKFSMAVLATITVTLVSSAISLAPVLVHIFNQVSAMNGQI